MQAWELGKAENGTDEYQWRERFETEAEKAVFMRHFIRL